jgi:aspartyl-tRNA(Asn)/glutamyl-tRNA(Gln) amidotransferase subunit C
MSFKYFNLASSLRHVESGKLELQGFMAISKDEIKKIAQLARLELNKVEIEKYQEQLASVLGYIDKLKEVKTSNLDILGLDSDEYNQVREDEIFLVDEQEKKIILNQVPEKEDDQIKVERVI